MFAGAKIYRGSRIYTETESQRLLFYASKLMLQLTLCATHGHLTFVGRNYPITVDVRTRHQVLPRNHMCARQLGRIDACAKVPEHLFATFLGDRGSRCISFCCASFKSESFTTLISQVTLKCHHATINYYQAPPDSVHSKSYVQRWPHNLRTR
jgi:hypothetical protein